MFQVTCVDEHGEVLSALTQWDINQSLYVDDYEYSFAPKFHFCNKNSKRSLGVQSVLSNGRLTVDIPNELLREPYPIIIYVYAVQDESGKTLQIIHMPVRPRVQPSDYEYVDNIRVIYLEDLIAEVKECIEKYDASELVRVENETIRIENENQRIANENQRQVNEENRQVTSANAVSACNQATQASTEQTQLCNQSTQASNEQTQACKQQTEECNQSTDSCNQQTQACKQQTNTCNESTQASNEQTELCNQATTECNQQTELCSQATNSCNQQTEECREATDSTLRAKELVDGLLYDIDGGNAFTNPDTMFQIDGGNCESNNG